MMIGKGMGIKMIYYFPYYCYRSFPELTRGIIEILNNITISGKIKVYQNLDNAIIAGEEMLCDDDDFGILVIDCTNGVPAIKENPNDLYSHYLVFDFTKFFDIQD